MILLNGPPGVGKSTIARRLHHDLPLSLLVDFDELWLLISDWEHNDDSQRLAFVAGLAMARVHLEAGYDVIAPQLGVREEYFEAIDAMVGETSAVCHQIVLIGRPERMAEQNALASARPHTAVISTEGGVDATYRRVREALQRWRAV